MHIQAGWVDKVKIIIIIINHFLKVFFYADVYSNHDENSSQLN